MVDGLTAEWGGGVGCIPKGHGLITNAARSYYERGTLLLPTRHALIANAARSYCQQATLLLPEGRAFLRLKPSGAGGAGRIPWTPINN